MEEFSEFPNNWTSALLCEVTDINPTLDKSGIDEELKVSFVPMAAVEAGTGRIDISQLRKFAEVNKGYTPFQKDDVLFAKITPCMENGKIAVVPELYNHLGFGSTEFHVLRARGRMEPKFLYYFVSSQAFRYEAEHNMTGAVGQRRVPTRYLEEYSIPLPPLNEQKRIVAKIEELFSKIDEAERCLNAIIPVGNSALGLTYKLRQSILKKAFSGKLVPQYPTDEPASVLLERIRAEKRALQANAKIFKSKRKAL